MSEMLTNETLKKKMENSFDLINYAIKQARGLILSGRPTRVRTAVQNPAYQVLLEIQAGKDVYDDIYNTTRIVPKERPQPEMKAMIVDDDIDDEDDDEIIEEGDANGDE